MSDNKWTPGPWYVETPDPDTKFYADITDQQNDTVDVIASIGPAGWLESGSDPKANARLIAAAPELAEALAALLDANERLSYLHDRDDGFGDYDDAIAAAHLKRLDATKRAERALAKARGEAE